MDEYSDDYQPIPPSARNHAARMLAGHISAMKLAPPDMEAMRDPDGKYYSINFARDPACRGEVRIYGSGYVRVWWTAVLPGVPDRGDRIYSSIEEMATFLELAFVDANWPLAVRVPTYEYKRGPRLRNQPTPTMAPANDLDIDDNFFCADREER